MDRLSKIFYVQSNLNQVLGVATTKISGEEREELLRKYCLALSMKVAELSKEVGAEWWKSKKSIDYDKAKEESVDILHFLTTVFMLLGMDAKEVFEEYGKKHATNMTNRPDWDSGDLNRPVLSDEQIDLIGLMREHKVSVHYYSYDRDEFAEVGFLSIGDALEEFVKPSKVDDENFHPFGIFSEQQNMMYTQTEFFESVSSIMSKSEKMKHMAVVSCDIIGMKK